MLKNSIKFISNLQTLSLGDLFRELESEVQTKKLNNLRLAWQRKFSFPFCVLLFVLPGVCLGAGAGGKGRHKSYLWGILMVGIYFILWQTADTLVNSDFFSPLAGAWMPNLVILVMGVYLLKRLSW